MWVFVRFIFVVTEIKKSECIKESFILIELNGIWVCAKTGPLCPMFCTMRSPVPLAKFQMAPILSFLISSWSKKKEPRYACLSEAKASHSHKMWTEVSSSVLHFLQVRLLLSPIIYINVFSTCYVH